MLQSAGDTGNATGRKWRGRFFRSGLAGAMALALMLCGVGLVSCRDPGWMLVRGSLRRQFSAVRWMGTAELAQWLGDPARRPPVLLDLRTAPEYAVSHLPNAIRVEPGTLTIDPGLSRGQPIVTYCSVGARSAAYAEVLRRAGFREVWNLEGSLFQWANEGRPLVSGGRATQKVHPYSRAWGWLLKDRKRAAFLP